jgi:hypothetical protein
MTIPQQPPDREIPEPQGPDIDVPGQDDPMPPETPPDEYPVPQEPDYRAPGADEPPMQA